MFRLGMRKLLTDLLPLTSLVWVSPQLLVAAGHDCVPLSLHLDGDLGLALGTRFEEAEVIPAEEEGGTPVAAMKMFRAK